MSCFGGEYRPKLDIQTIKTKPYRDTHQHIVSNWSRVLVARELTAGAKHSSRYNEITADFYHPNFVARQFGLGQHIPLPYKSLVGSLRREGISLVDLSRVLKANHDKLLLFTWENFRRIMGETSSHSSWWPAIKKFVFPSKLWCLCYPMHRFGERGSCSCPTKCVKCGTTSFQPTTSAAKKAAVQHKINKKPSLAAK